MKLFKPVRFFPFIGLPRWIEFLIQGILFVGVIELFFHVLKGEPRYNDFWVNALLLSYCFLVFCLYKIFNTFSVVDSLEINDDQKEIKVVYWLFYFYKKNKVFKYDNFSFFAHYDAQFFGRSVGIRMYDNNKYKIKLNAQNGWKEEQIKEIIKEFLKITNGEMRKPLMNVELD